MPRLENEKLDFLSIEIPKPEYPYFSTSEFFAKVTPPNKQFFIVGSSSLEPEVPSS